jgi:hypothetical protein
VNAEWAIGQLREFIQLCEEYKSQRFVGGNYAGDRKLGPLMDELKSREAMVRRILNAAEPTRGNLSTIRHDSSYGIGVDTILESSKYSLGLLARQREIEENLAPLGPQMRADQLHHIVWGAAAALWNGGHHTSAVQRAATFVNAHVQDLVDRRDVSDAGLMQQVFSKDDPSPGKSRLRWPGDATDLTVRSMNEGLRNLAPGLFQTIRNPATHTTSDLSEQEALEQLAMLSMLARWVDACDVVAQSD